MGSQHDFPGPRREVVWPSQVCRFFSFLWTDTKLRCGVIKMKNPKSQMPSPD